MVMPKNSPAAIRAARTAQPSRGLPEAFARMAALLGADLINTDLASVTSIVRELASPELGPVAVSADLVACLPELAVIDSSGPGDNEPGTWWTAVTRARIGVAATGSVLVAEMREADRLLPILARRHVVLLPSGSILPTLA